MLSEQNNRRLTEVGPGTPMGDLLRRYWHPIAAASEFDQQKVKPIRLLGEDLVLYKGASGHYGLVGRQCTHRGADLAFGFVDGEGLRCNYHGWLFDADGKCLSQPYEDRIGNNARLRVKAKAIAYPAEELAGLVWAYLGPEPRPLVPHWEPFTWENGFVQIVFAYVPCNWFQCQENSIDPVHFEWLHDNWGSIALQNSDRTFSPAHLKLDFEEFDHGFLYRRVREGGDERNELWTVGRVCLWPNALFIGDHFEWRVPIDDENTLSVTWIYARVPAHCEPYRQDRIPAWTGPVIDPQTGHLITSHIMNQDFAAWVGQGRIADRAEENLGASDRGITMIRRRFLNDIAAVERGEDPKGIVRDPELNICIRLPIVQRELLETAPTTERILAERRFWRERGIPDDYIYQAGQPEEVRRAYNKAMGLTVG